jgi:hypothetical protein
MGQFTGGVTTPIVPYGRCVGWAGKQGRATRLYAGNAIMFATHFALLKPRQLID